MNDEKITNPFDKFIKENFSRREIIQSFIQQYLPSKFRDGLDLDSIEIVKDSFVDEELSEHFSDILYKIKKENDDSFLYFLLEHKSYNDKWIWFQILRYMINIWGLYLKQNKSAEYLPAVIPVIISHGTAKYKKGQSLRSLFKTSEETKGFIPDFDCEILDLSSISDDAIKGELILRIQFLLLKYSHNPQFYKKISDALEMANEELSKNNSVDFLKSLIQFLGSVVEESRTGEVVQEIHRILTGGDEIMSTMADRWFREGVQKGIEQGKQQGIEQGKLQGIEEQKIIIARRLIESGMSDEEIHKITDLKASRINEIRREGKKLKS